MWGGVERGEGRAKQKFGLVNTYVMVLLGCTSQRAHDVVKASRRDATSQFVSIMSFRHHVLAGFYREGTLTFSFHLPFQL